MLNNLQADVNAKPVKELKIYQMMVDLLHAEKKCTEKIRDSEEEVIYRFVFIIFCFYSLLLLFLFYPTKQNNVMLLFFSSSQNNKLFV